LGGGSGKIAFASDRSGSVQIWVMDADNPENRRQVTNIEAGACQPAWSPDGQRLAFVTPCNGPRLTYPGARIKIVELETGEITDLKLHGGAFEPAWSPDGQTIAYTTFDNDRTEIHAINLADLTTRPLSQRGQKNTGPGWSADGAYIAFSSDVNYVDEIWIMKKDGSSQEPLTQAGALKYFTQPAWSPDGKWLVTSLKELNATSPMPVLALLERANPRKGETRLTTAPLSMEDASFSPDGQWLVFWTLVEGTNLEIMRIGLDGEIVPMTNHLDRDFHPAWSSQ
jgi:eukaryotic-like serine/threonine-protein kinase